MLRNLAALCLLTGIIVAPVRAEKFTKAEIAQKGKSATAFVEAPGATGTAFCVHPSGLFITNEHVIRGKDKGEIRLVVDAGLKTQRILPATVVRADAALDLALLRATTKDPLPALALGSIDGVSELMDVVAFGFPLGTAMVADKKDYPAISVNAGHVSSLRRKDGEIERIQVDVSVTFGSSGGPVLDENAKVVGVIVSGIPGQRGLNLAIPVSHVTRYVSKPDFQFTPPDLKQAALDKPVEFKAKVVSILPGAKEPSVRLILQAGDEKARELPMVLRDGTWSATAVPVTKMESRIEVAVRSGIGSVTGLVDDAVIKVGDKPVRLSGIKRIDLGMSPRVLLADGKTMIEGKVSALGEMEIGLGAQKIKLDLSKVDQLTFQAGPGLTAVAATIVASVDGVDIGRLKTQIAIRDANTTTPVNPTAVAISPAPIAEDRVVKKMPEVFGGFCAGGGGRYLILHLQKLKKLAVFDVNEARITKYIPLAEDEVNFAAGMDSVVVGLVKSGKLERWSLATGELEKSAIPPFREEIKWVLMGHGSTGPVIVNGYPLSLDTFQHVSGYDRVWSAVDYRHPGGDGTVYGTGDRGGGTTFVFEGGAVHRYSEGGPFGHVVPGPDGREVFTAQGIASRTMRRGDADDASYGYCVPAMRGSYFLSIQPSDAHKGGGGFTVYLRGLKQPIGKIDNAEHGLHFDGGGGDGYRLWSRVFFVPDAKVIISIPLSRDQLVLHKFDPEAALEKSGLDYLIVTSIPPRTVKIGETYKYPLIVKVKKGPATFKVEAGPKGLEVSKEGVVSWKVPADTTEGDQDVILTVRDTGGQEIFHTFPVRVVK